MRGDSHNNSDDDSHDRADGGALRPRVLGSEPAAGGDWLSPLLIALLGAMALGLIFFLSPLMARGRAGWSKQSDSTQPGGAPAGGAQVRRIDQQPPAAAKPTARRAGAGRPASRTTCRWGRARTWRWATLRCAVRETLR